jgi:hypothetical protein
MVKEHPPTEGSDLPGFIGRPTLDEAGISAGPEESGSGLGGASQFTSGFAQEIPHVLCAPHEAEPGATFRLARSLRKSEETPKKGWEQFPSDLVRVPLPDRVLDSLDGLSGCEVRLCLLMVRASYSWVEDLGEFRASSRWFTAREIEEEAGGLGMHRESLRRAAKKIEDRGWLSRKTREGKATAYRWRLSVPRSRYTPIPAPLLHAHQRLSHSALTLLLSVLRATWGWTTREDGTVKHRRAAELSTSDLEAMTGLSRPTVRDVQEELRAKGALYMRRKHGGAPWTFAVDLSFFRHHLQKSYTPTNREKNSNKHTRTEEPTSQNAHTKGRSREGGSAYRVTEDWEEEAIRILCAAPIEMSPGVARDLVIRRGQEVVQGAIKAFRRRSDIDSPAGWMCSAIEELWFGPSIPNKSSSVRQSSGSRHPIARVFEDLTEKREGWEWDENGETAEGEKLEERSGSLGSGQAEGVTHSEMCGLIEDLGQPPCDWDTVDRPGKAPLFVPSTELANWAYFRRDSGSDQFQEAARRVVNLRARHEGRESPLSAE